MQVEVKGKVKVKDHVKEVRFEPAVREIDFWSFFFLSFFQSFCLFWRFEHVRDLLPTTQW